MLGLSDTDDDWGEWKGSDMSPIPHPASSQTPYTRKDEDNNECGTEKNPYQEDEDEDTIEHTMYDQWGKDTWQIEHCKGNDFWETRHWRGNDAWETASWSDNSWFIDASMDTISHTWADDFWGKDTHNTPCTEREPPIGVPQTQEYTDSEGDKENDDDKPTEKGASNADDYYNETKAELERTFWLERGKAIASSAKNTDDSCRRVAYDSLLSVQRP